MKCQPLSGILNREVVINSSELAYRYRLGDYFCQWTLDHMQMRHRDHQKFSQSFEKRKQFPNIWYSDPVSVTRNTVFRAFGMILEGCFILSKWGCSLSCHYLFTCIQMKPLARLWRALDCTINLYGINQHPCFYGDLELGQLFFKGSWVL